MKIFTDEESDDEYSPSPENSPRITQKEKRDQISGFNLLKNYKFDGLDGFPSNSQSKEFSIKKEINQIFQNIYYDVSADKIEFSNISSYQKYIIKCATKDNEFVIIACKCLILRLTEFINVIIAKNSFYFNFLLKRKLINFK